MHLSGQAITQVVLTFLLSSTVTNALSFARQATSCNGHPELCDRNYGNVTFVGAHDSYAIGINNLATNQDQNITQQLNDGVRMLQMQAHNQSGVIQLCHTSCSLYNGGTLADYLGTVKTWMDSNPNDVVSLLIVNSDNIPATEYDAVFKSAGLDTLAYAPPTSSLPATGWPTLGTLISSGKRLVAFLTTTADFNTVPYLIDEFTNIWETAFDVTDTSFNCSVDRTNGDPSTQMYLINHFLDQNIAGFPAPDPEHANVTNGVSGVGSLGQQVDTCAASNGRNPNFMLVDFYEYGGGSVFQVAATANGVTYDPSTPIATPVTSTSSGSPSLPTGSGSTQSGAAGLQVSRDHLYASLAVVSSMLVAAFSVL